jgi:hypothetical protein
MKMKILVAAAVIALAGCSTVSKAQFDALEARVAATEQQAKDAAAAAAAGQGAAASANAAKATADQALQAAREASDRAARIAETCCARK